MLHAAGADLTVPSTGTDAVAVLYSMETNEPGWFDK